MPRANGPTVVIVILNNDKWRPIVIVHGVIRWKRTIQFFVVVESQTSPALCWIMAVLRKYKGLQISIRKENIKHIIDLKRWLKINSPSTLSARSAVTIALGIPDQRRSHHFTLTRFIRLSQHSSSVLGLILFQPVAASIRSLIMVFPDPGNPTNPVLEKMLGQLGSNVINLNHLFFKGVTTASTWDN